MDDQVDVLSSRDVEKGTFLPGTLTKSPHLLQQLSSYCFSSLLQSVQLKFQSSLHIFLALLNLLALFLSRNVQGMLFMLIPLLTSERLWGSVKWIPNN